MLPRLFLGALALFSTACALSLPARDVDGADATAEHDGSRLDTGSSTEDSGLADVPRTDASRPDGGRACSDLGAEACAIVPGCQPRLCSDCEGQRKFFECYRAGTTPPTCPVPQCRTCEDRTTEASCLEDPSCFVQRCPTCDRTEVFSACSSAGNQPGCPPLACPQDCSMLPLDGCETHTGCRLEGCFDCDGVFVPSTCAPDNGAPPPICTASCPLPCEQLDQMSCKDRSDCHPVFENADPVLCGCPGAGCCARFVRCAPGDTVACEPPTGFDCALPPPSCEGDYRVAYGDPCFEGCVLADDCTR